MALKSIEIRSWCGYALLSELIFIQIARNMNFLYENNQQLLQNAQSQHQLLIQFDCCYQIIYKSTNTMVKIKTITHNPQSSAVRTTSAEHNFSRAREFQRAYVASKLQKIFAKPFLGSLSGHSDGISALAKCPSALNKLISGAHDGQIKIWDISQRKALVSTFAHQTSVKGVSFSKDGRKLVSASQEAINLFDFDKMLSFQESDGKKQRILTPITKYLSKSVLGNVDHCWESNQFATAGQIVQVWSYQRTKPIYRLQWNCDSVIKVKYNPAEPNILCATANDRSIILYDLRGQSPIQKVTLQNKSACLCFNPIEPINFTVGNDDSNCYSFDVRKMEKAKTIHKDHIGAVIDLDYSPTGREFATGSFDKTVRIFGNQEGRSKQVYHTKRMQILSSVVFSMDAHYVFSGSEDMNIRIWKAEASRPIGVVSERENRAIEYRSALVNKFKHNNQIRRIANHRHLPKYIRNANKKRQDQQVSKFRKRINKEANTGIKQNERVEKQKVIVNVEHRQANDEQPKSNKRNKLDNKEQVEQQ